jgi:hypothetical protein
MEQPYYLHASLPITPAMLACAFHSLKNQAPHSLLFLRKEAILAIDLG